MKNINGMYYQRAFAVVVCAVLAMGCGSKRAYELAPVSGIVTFDGRPVAGATVSYQPQGAVTNPGPGSVGKSDVSGRYVLETIRAELGAVPGPHAVRIYSPKAPVLRDDGPQQRELFPPRYNFRTELTFMVPVEGSDTANFDLVSK